MNKVLTIAGTDPTGGAGAMADLKTFTAHKMFGMSVITAVVAQNTCGVYTYQDIDADNVRAQLDAVFTDIDPDAVKIGMVSSIPIIAAIVEKLKQYQAKNIVVDPVMISTSGGRLLSDDAMNTLQTQLIPMADIITPNLMEAECLCGFPIHTKEDMLKAARSISKSVSGAVLVKGGHLEDCADDLLYTGGEAIWFPCEKIDNPNTHGTGCTLSSAIACNLADGLTAAQSVQNAKTYITGALKANLNLGKGRGPLNHMFGL